MRGGVARFRSALALLVFLVVGAASLLACFLPSFPGAAAGTGLQERRRRKMAAWCSACPAAVAAVLLVGIAMPASFAAAAHAPPPAPPPTSDGTDTPIPIPCSSLPPRPPTTISLCRSHPTSSVRPSVPLFLDACRWRLGPTRACCRQPCASWEASIALGHEFNSTQPALGFLLAAKYCFL